MVWYNFHNGTPCDIYKLSIFWKCFFLVLELLVEKKQAQIEMQNKKQAQIKMQNKNTSAK